MKKLLYIFCINIIIFSACKDDDVNVFEKTADERAAEAIAALKADLVAPANGWRVKYRPEAGSGSFYVLMDFEEDNKVNIKTDLGANDGEFFEQTITYRIDNSLGLELILESYSFFSFLFEQNAATFGAEYEFNYVNKTPDNALVFSSKTDISNPTILLFEEAAEQDDDLLGVALSTNLNTLSGDLDMFSSSLKLTYENKDLAFYISLDASTRVVSFTAASLKSNTDNPQAIDFTTPYIIKGDSLVFDSRFSGNYFGNAISFKGIRFNDLTDGSIDVCAEPLPIHKYSGVTSANDKVLMETTLVNSGGKFFAEESTFYFSPLNFIVDNGISAAPAIADHITGALEMHLYYGLELEDGTVLYGIGFAIQNQDQSITFALREFTPVLNDNNIVFNFEPDISIFGDPTDANIDNINIYLNALTEGDKTFVLKLFEDRYEFHNPCTGWSFVFVNANQ